MNKGTPYCGMPEDTKLALIRARFYKEYRVGALDSGDGRARPHLREWVREYFPLDKRSAICDLGCGRGELILIAQEMGYVNISGVDASASQVRARLSDRVFKRDLLQHLKEQADESLDAVVTFDVLEHLTRTELLELGDEISRVLKREGKWLLHVPNAAGIFGSRIRYADVTHESSFTAESIRQYSEVFGFCGVRVFEERPTVHGWKSMARWLLWMIGRLPFVVLWAAETGSVSGVILSQNMSAVIIK